MKRPLDIETLPMDDPRRIKRLRYGVILSRDVHNTTKPTDTEETFDVGRPRAGLMLPFPYFIGKLIVTFQIWRLR